MYKSYCSQCNFSQNSHYRSALTYRGSLSHLCHNATSESHKVGEKHVSWCIRHREDRIICAGSFGSFSGWILLPRIKF